MLFIFLSIIIIVFVLIFCYVSKEQKRISKLTETGPFSIAIIDNVERKRKNNSDTIRYYNECKITYVDLYGIERDAVIDLPYSEVPVGGQLKIAYNSENYKEVYLVEAVFMDTPEYIEKMRKKGYIKTQDGFVKKNMKNGN